MHALLAIIFGLLLGLSPESCRGAASSPLEALIQQQAAVHKELEERKERLEALNALSSGTKAVFTLFGSSSPIKKGVEGTLLSEIAEKKAEFNALQGKIEIQASNEAQARRDQTATETGRFQAEAELVRAQSAPGFIQSKQHDVTIAEQKALTAQHQAAGATFQAEAAKTAATERTKQIAIAAGIGGTVALTITAALLIYKAWSKRRPRIIEKDDTSIGNKHFPRSNLDDVSLRQALQTKIERKFDATCSALVKHLPLSNMLFFGDPGTGKTMTAVAFVRKISELGLAHHIILRGSSFKMLPSAGEASAQFRAALRFGKTSKLPLYIVVDEAEEIACDPTLPQASEKTRALTTDIRSFFTQTADKNIAFIFCTNFPKLIDVPILSRISRANRFEFLKPGEEELARQLELYLHKNITKAGIKVLDAVFQMVPHTARILHDRGLVGRDVDGLTNDILQELLATGNTALTGPYFAQLADALSQHVQLQDIQPYAKALHS